MPYSVTAIHWTYKPSRLNIFPLKVFVVVDGVTTPIHTPHKVSRTQWDKDKRLVINHPNAESINADMRRRIVEKEAELLLATRAGETLTKDLVKGKKRDGSFVKFALEIAKKVTNKKGEKVIDMLEQKEINRIITYKGSGLLLGDIDVTWLRKYNDFEEARGMEQNTRNTTFKWLRRVVKKAASEKLIRENPFDEYTIPDYVQGDTVYLVEEEKAGLIKLLDTLPAGPLYNTLVYFLFACYAGPRHSDWKKFHENEMVYDGFLRLRPEKKSRGFVVLPVGKTLTMLLERMRQLNEPPYSLQKCNIYLKAIFSMPKVTIGRKTGIGINKDGTTHVARHSFGYMCASLGLPKSTTAELMGISVQTVEVYYHLTGENIIKQAAALKDV